ncbi:ImuA family protein [Maliponia aquimaris]|uniref:Protein ImuA n=1 Tax=Maliponia aquimaris TaxID=1673631 RepID=A0A238K575_9RHOB|nr:hypothetical protein [Maliponia aquimaris]SMX38058.1 hypothetical protein MAA8898_01354 [Maliponia aquimaris]
MTMASALLSRRPHAPPPALTLWHEIALPLARVHEICGQARRTLALHVMAQAGGPVIWIHRRHSPDQLNPCGMVGLFSPAEVILAATDRPEDSLWAMEEALRSGAAPVVVADLAEPPGMTPVRRLHLAAEAGAENGFCRPLGLLLTPGTGGAPGIETRLSCDPAHGPGGQAWRIERLRARMMPPKTWRLEGGRLAGWPGAESREG